MGGPGFLKKPANVSWRVWIITLSKRLVAKSYESYCALGPGGKALVWLWILIKVSLLSVFVVLGPARLFQALYDFSQELKTIPYGWVIISLILKLMLAILFKTAACCHVLTVVANLPPLFGISSALSICGFAYGPWKGFLIGSAAILLGSSLVFTLLRALFAPRIKSWTQQNRKWVALEQVIQARGLPLICLIRLCPIPIAYGNALFASIESVALWQFMLATICLLPKLWFIIFIGSQAAALSDSESRGEMTLGTKILHVLSIVLTMMLTTFTGWFVWRLVEDKIRQLEGGDRLLDDMDGEDDEEIDSFLRGERPELSSRTGSQYGKVEDEDPEALVSSLSPKVLARERSLTPLGERDLEFGRRSPRPRPPDQLKSGSEL